MWRTKRSRKVKRMERRLLRWNISSGVAFRKATREGNVKKRERRRKEVEMRGWEVKAERGACASGIVKSEVVVGGRLWR